MNMPTLEDAMARVALRTAETYDPDRWREHSMEDHLRLVLPGTDLTYEDLNAASETVAARIAEVAAVGFELEDVAASAFMNGVLTGVVFARMCDEARGRAGSQD